MSTNIVYNGTTYTIPAINDVAWGAAVSDFLIAIPSGMLTKVGGSWALTGSDLDLGGSYGLVSLYLKSKTATLAQAGFIRMAKTDTIAWRNNANDGNNLLGVNTSNAPTFNTVEIPTISSSSTLTNKTIVGAANNISGLMNANIAANAAIIYDKLVLTASIVNADIATAAAIALSKLAAVTASRALVSNASGVITASAVTATELGYLSGVTSAIQTQIDGYIVGAGTVVDNALTRFDGTNGKKVQGCTSADPTLSDSGVLTLNAAPLISTFSTAGLVHNAVTTGLLSSSLLVDADVHATAAIAVSKLAALTASRAMVTGAGGFAAAATTTATEIGYVNGVTSAIQTQINTKAEGAASSTDKAVARFDSTGGKIIQNSGVIIDDSNNVTGAAQITAAILKATTSLIIEDPGAGTGKVTITAPTSLTDWSMTLPADDGGSNQYLKTDGSGVTSWGTPSGAGDVVGSATSLDNELVKFDSISGKSIQSSTSNQPTLSDDGILTLKASPIINNLTTAGILHNAVTTGLLSSSLVVNADVHAAAAIVASKLGVLDGFTSGAGTVSNADTVLGGIQKLNGNIGLLNNIGVNTKSPTGFVTKSNMIFTWNESTARDLTITNTAGTYSYYIKGVLYTVAQTSTKTKQVTDTDGVWWFYFDESMDLQATQTFSTDLFSIYCVVRSAYWDTTNKLWIIRSVESHEASMNWSTHSYLHSVFGAMYLSGGATTTAALPGNKTLAQVRPTLDAVVFLDEDLQHTTTAHAATDAWRKLYRSGATGAWRAYTIGEPSIPVICDTADGAGDGGATFINTFATGAWGLTVPVTNNYYFNTYLFATNDPTVGRTVIMIPGQAQSSNLGVAQGYGLQSLNLGTLPSPEFLPIVQLTWQYKDTNKGDGPTENTAGVTLISATDLRLIRATGTSLVTSGAHNALSGRDAAAAHPATSISNTPAGTIAADTVQAALNELDSEKVAGPAAAVVDNEIVRFDSTGGKIVQGYTATGPTVDDNGIMSIANATATTSTTTGGLKCAGGLSVSNATDATSVDNGGSLTLAGGAAVKKILYVGTSVQTPAVTGATALGLTATNGTLTLASTTGGVAVTTHSSSGDDFTVNTDKLVVEGDTGRVGIGISAPTVALDVVGAVKATTGVTVATGQDVLSKHKSITLLGTGKFTANNSGAQSADVSVYYSTVGGITIIHVPSFTLTADALDVELTFAIALPSGSIPLSRTSSAAVTRRAAPNDYFWGRIQVSETTGLINVLADTSGGYFGAGLAGLYGGWSVSLLTS